MSKLTFLAGLGVGYVLGARAGRERYDQIADATRSVWRKPEVVQARESAKQTAASGAGHLADAAASKARDTVGGSVAAAADKVRDAVHERTDGHASGTGGGSEEPLAPYPQPTGT